LEEKGLKQRGGRGTAKGGGGKKRGVVKSNGGGNGKGMQKKMSRKEGPKTRQLYENFSE